jgi:hypothetical protein
MSLFFPYSSYVESIAAGKEGCWLCGEVYQPQELQCLGRRDQRTRTSHNHSMSSYDHILGGYP